MSADKQRAKTRRLLLLREMFQRAYRGRFPVDHVVDVKSLARLAADGLVSLIKRDRMTGFSGYVPKREAFRNRRWYVERAREDS